MSYRIISDSCLDYTNAVDLSDIIRVPLTLTASGISLRDDGSIQHSELVRLMAESKDAPRSACPSPGDFLDACNCGADELYIVTLSGKISGTYASAVSAAAMFRAETERKVHVFDSRSAAAAQLLICLKLRELAEQGLSFEEVVEKTEEYISTMTTLFVLENLDVFRKNGRLSHLQSAVTAALGIRLVMGASQEGQIVLRAKALSTAAAISRMVDLIRKKCAELKPAERIMVMTECGCLERARKLKETIIGSCGFARVIICRAGGLSTLYANVGGLIVSF